MSEIRKIGEFEILAAIPKDFGYLSNDTIQLGLGDMDRLANNLLFMTSAHSFWIGQVLMGIGGFKILWPGVAESWSIWASIAGREHRRSMLETARTLVQEFIDEYRIWRMQAMISDDLPQTWLEHIGFEFESVLECFSFKGLNAKMYKIITKKYLPDGVL
jgi:hypothetical protein